jgi:hypothetical protein
MALRLRVVVPDYILVALARDETTQIIRKNIYHRHSRAGRDCFFVRSDQLIEEGVMSVTRSKNKAQPGRRPSRLN